MVADTSKLQGSVTPIHGNEQEHRRLLADGINAALEGRINSIGTITLAVSSATTTLDDLRIGATSVILLMPTTASAATAQGAGIHITTTKESATITHNNTADVDKIFRYAIFGG